MSVLIEGCRTWSQFSSVRQRLLMRHVDKAGTYRTL
jgi:hypothetical protein